MSHLAIWSRPENSLPWLYRTLGRSVCQSSPDAGNWRQLRALQGHSTNLIGPPMILLTGTLLAVVDRAREWEGERWTERTLHLLGDDFHTTEVTLSRAGANSFAFDESRLPDPHQPVALMVFARGGAQKRVYWTATSVASEDDLMAALGLATAGK